MGTRVSEALTEETTASVRPAIWQVMLQILMAPTQGFKSVKNFPRWLIPGILCVLVLLAHEVIIRPQTLNDLRQTVQNNSSLSLTEMQTKIKMIDFQLEHSVSKKLLLQGLVLLTLIHFSKILGLALLIWIVLQLLLAGVTYRQALSVSALSFLVVIPETIVKIPAIMAQGSTKVYFGLAVLFPPDLHDTALFRIFRGLDIFTIWFVILLGIGLSVGLGVRRKHAYLLVGGLLSCRILLSAINFVVIGTG